MREPGNDEQELPPDGGEGHGLTRRAVLGSAAAGGVGLAALLQASRASEAAAGALAQVEPPLGAFFSLEVEGATGFFTEVSGLGSETEVIEQKVGDPTQGTIMKVPGQLKWNDIVLKRGVTTGLELYDWRRLQEDSSKAVAKPGSVALLDQEEKELARWNFEAAWPSKLSVGSFKMLSDDVMIVEEFVLVSERIRRVK